MTRHNPNGPLPAHKDPSLYFTDAEWMAQCQDRKGGEWRNLSTEMSVKSAEDMETLESMLAGLRAGGIAFRLARPSAGRVTVWRTAVGWRDNSVSFKDAGAGMAATKNPPAA